MSFGKDSSFVFMMQDGKLINIGRSDNTADKQPFDDIEEEVWRIFGEHKQLQKENTRLKAEHDALVAACKFLLNYSFHRHLKSDEWDKELCPEKCDVCKELEKAKTALSQQEAE
jgi:hypothetical protein